MANPVAIAGFGFLFGGLVGFVLASFTGAPSDEAEAFAERGSSRVDANRGADAADDPAADAPSVADSGSGPQTAPIDSRDVARLRETVSSTEAEPSVGSGVIDGVVKDEKGNGIAGVKVKAARISERGEAAVFKRGKIESSRSLDDELKSTAENWQKKQVGSREATTAGDGSYAFSDLADAKWALSATADGYVVTPKGTSSNLRIGSHLNFEGKPVARVKVTARLPDGRAAKRLNLEIQSSGVAGTWSELWKADAPHVDLVPGHYQIRGILGKAQRSANGVEFECASESTTVDIALGENPPLDLELKPRLGIRGFVYFGEGMQLSQGSVVHTQIPANGTVDLKALSEINARQWISGENNSFEIMDLKAGRYAVGIVPGWNAPVLQHEICEVKDRVVEIDIDLTKIDTTKFITATVKGPRGVPVANVNFTYMVASDQNSSNGWIQPIQQGEGKFLLPPDEQLTSWYSKPDNDGKLKLTARTELFGDKTVECTKTQRDVVFEYGEAATVEVTLSGYLGSGLEGKLDVALKRAGGEENYFYYNDESKLKADGTAKLGPTEVGEYTLELQSVGENRWNKRTIASQKMNLVVGTNTATLAVPALYRLTITVKGETGADGEWVALQGNGVWDNKIVKDSMATFENLSAGKYDVQVDHNGMSARATVELPGQSDVTFTLQKPNAMRVNIHDENGYFGQLGLKDGDLIVGFDGVLFADQQAMTVAFATIIAKPNVTLNLQRGGQSLEVQAEGARMLNPQELGASWWPVAR